MKLSSAAVFALGLLAAPAAFAEPVKPAAATTVVPASGPTLEEAEETFNERCYMCHSAEGGAAPAIEKLNALEPAVIVEKLTTGTMAAMASGLTDEQKREIAVFLTKKPLPASGDLPAITP